MKSGIATLLLLPLILTACCASPRRAPAPGHAPRRIISLAPSITETLYAVGAGGRVVGVTAFCNWPPEVLGKPVVGEFVRVNFEMLLWLMPDLVIASSDSPSETVDYSLDEYGIPKMVTSASTLPEAVQTVREIAAEVGNGPLGERVARDMETRAQAVAQKLAGAPPVKALLVFGHEPLILAGPNTFADDLIRRGGGINLAGNSRVKYPMYSIERIVYEGPQVIIEASRGMGYQSPDADAIHAFWGQWPDIPAVKNNRVVIINADLVTRPGPRIVEGLEEIAKALHPERMGDDTR